ncbi:hypothetical protein [Achromobacter insuavis]|uniref:hypothetical protein n=1 Tax=Achromobacter insuavis TaxID=1287735 RepID=UPI001F12F1D9|nr:hypothetical protein [Achromobacter insuavis]
MRATIYTSVMAAVMLMGPAATALADDCDAILEQGVRNTYSEIRSGDFRTNFNNAYCIRNSATQSSDGGTNLGLSFKGFGLDYGQSTTDTVESRNENCGNSAGGLSDQKYLNALQRIADPGIVEAWRSCKETKIGLVITGQINGSILAITYRFRPAGNITQTTIQSVSSIMGAQCETPLEKGTIIGTAGWAQSCRRLGDDAVSIVVNTDFGPAIFYLPPPKRMSPPNTASVAAPSDGALYEKCANWRGPGRPVECLELDRRSGSPRPQSPRPGQAIQ